jgi:hypothetical protein
MLVDHSDDLDALIDDTARSLSDVSPRASLREGVRVRVAGTREWWRVPVWQPALTGALVVALVVLLWPRQRPDAPTGGFAPSSAPAGVGADLSEQAVAVESQVPATSANVERIAVSAVGENVMPPPVPGATIVAPFEIEPIASELIVVEAISLPMPVALRPVEIEPLTFQRRGELQ